MLVRRGYQCFIGVLICLLYSCSVKTGICVLEDKYNCVPIKSYTNWNRCVGDCSSVKIQPKTKPYLLRREGGAARHTAGDALVCPITWVVLHDKGNLAPGAPRPHESSRAEPTRLEMEY